MAQLGPCLQSLFGLMVFLALAYAASEARGNIKWQPVFLALGAQVGLAAFIMHAPWVQTLFFVLSRGIGEIKAATASGTSFVFGYIGGGPVPFAVVDNKSTFIFALQALPMVIVISALSMLLFHWRILPCIVAAFSWVLKRTLNIGGALGVCAAAKVFLGQTEAPLLVRPYLKDVTRSELFSVMVLGMATTSASVMVIYASILEKTIDHPISHILTASIISAPAAIALSRVMIPQDGPDTAGEIVSPYTFSGAMEAISTGATDGMNLFINIVAMLVVMLALVALCNSALGALPITLLNAPLSLQLILGYIMAPVAWLMGIPWHEAQLAGQLLGIKVALNEVMAFIQLAQGDMVELSGHSRIVMLYALCGFANLGSIGIQIGGIGTMAPERRREVISLGGRALVTGTMASCMSGTVVGLLSRIF